MEGISDIGYAQGALHECCVILGLQEDVKIVAITNRWRWTLDLTQSPNHPDFGKNMIKLERHLQERMGRPIDLRLESEADKNLRKKRNVLWSQNTTLTSRTTPPQKS